MKSLLSPCHSLTFPAAALSIAFAIGCASPGPPHAPSLNLPEQVKDLAAERVGDEVTLQWTTPEKTTDHIAIKGGITAEICRALVSAPPAPKPACTVVGHLTVQSGPSHAEDKLPPSLTTTPAALLAYRVQLLNPAGRSAGPSAEAFSATGSAPAPVEQLHATPVRNGVLIEWQQLEDPAPVRLDRVLISAATPASPAPAKVASPLVSKSTTRSKSRSSPPAATTAKPTANVNVVRLQTPKLTADAGGTMDATALKGESYRYTAQRVSEVTLNGRTVELRSTISPPMTVAVSDTFPPGIPGGLEAIPGGATASDRSIDLSWTPDTEPDLAGYNVYRQEVTPTGQVAAPKTRLNPALVVGPAYRDPAALPGHRYAYRVTAVDATGNESAPSAEVQETLREP